MLDRIRNLLELIRFSHTLFALPFAPPPVRPSLGKTSRFNGSDLVGIVLCMCSPAATGWRSTESTDRRFDPPTRALPATSATENSPLPRVWGFTLSVQPRSSPHRACSFSPTPELVPLRFRGADRGVHLRYSTPSGFTVLSLLARGSLLLAPAGRGLPSAAWSNSPSRSFWNGRPVLGGRLRHSLRLQDADFDRRAWLTVSRPGLGRASLRPRPVCHLLMVARCACLPRGQVSAGPISDGCIWLGFVPRRSCWRTSMARASRRPEPG